MLPADCAQRLVSLFTQALEDCIEQRETNLERAKKIQQGRAVLGDWNSEREDLVTEDAKTEKHETTEPSAEEIKDLEMLNKALEKALRVRSKFHQVPCETTKVSGTSNKKPASQAASEPPACHPKDKVPRTPQMPPASRKPVASRQPTAYMLKAPYKTDAVVKRLPVKIPTGRSSRTSKTAGKKLSPAGVASPKCAKTGKDSPKKVHVAAEPGLCSGSPKGPCRTTTPPWFAEGGDSAGRGPQVPEVNPDLDASDGTCPSGTDPLRQGTKPPTCTLQQNGSSLKLPLPYQKAFSKYSRLLEKCRDLKTVPEAAVTKRQFLEKLQATAMETELLPLLEHDRFPESSKASAIRAVYSLLCESGEHVPVLVKDEELSS
ncbi:PREDICTED: uncharacterized protein LOC106554870 [Thamnophis sirtalis]|uniref:Uncharacterized protein LOC106554870 n=1 Tax=Thamnophis sirtalis TaxID=35019 RepID=A0A6I9YWQ3_9SAUR|nr:PREDICTED: uncharacterized protein LOC106554870 [Thamnophis sirtalis]